MSSKDIGSIYVMILTSNKSIEKIISAYNFKMPFSEIHAAITYLGKFHFDYDESRIALDKNIDFLRKYLI